MTILELKLAFNQGFRWKPCDTAVPPTPLDAPPVSRWAQPGPTFTGPTAAAIPTGAGLDGVWTPPAADTPALPWGTAPAPAIQGNVPTRRIIEPYFDEIPTSRVPFPPRRSRKPKTTVATTTATTTDTTRGSTRGIRGRGGRISTRATTRSGSTSRPSLPAPTEPTVPPTPALVVVPVTTKGVPGSSREELDLVSVVQQIRLS